MVDGQLDWSGGVDSGKVKTIASATYPKGLGRNKLSWLQNATVRGGGITQRTGWQPLVQEAPWNGLFQGAFMHEPDFADPHILIAVGGIIYRVNVDTDNSVEDLSAAFGPGLTMPATETQFFFAEAPPYTIIQAGDLTTKPLFYEAETAPDGSMRRSNGFVAPGDPTNEIPPAGPMDFHANRLWYGFGQFYAAGDISGNKTTGTVGFGYRDSVLHVTENPIPSGGDAFIIPSGVGNIRALKHAYNLDTTLGQTPLFVMTRSTVFLSDPPLNRTLWSDADEAKNSPIQRVGLVKGGTYAERAVVPVNADIYFPSTPNGDIRSFSMSLRYFQMPGNIPISRNENRVVQFNDRSLLRFASGMEFNNRLWQTVLPVETPVGVGFQAVMPLDFDIVSSLDEREPPAWEGIYDVSAGPLVLQLLTGDFGGRERAFAVVWSERNGRIEIWECTLDNRFENGENRVTWIVEFPAYTWGDPLKAKQLTGGSIWIDKILGKVDLKLQYFVNEYPCPIDWFQWSECTAKDCRDEILATDCYPTDLVQYCESFMPDRDFPKPPIKCIGATKKPSNVGYQFRARLIIKGWCRIRGFLLYALPFLKGPYDNLKC